MAKLTSLPNTTIIDGLKGTLDFYVHKGIPCCRSWPQWKLTSRSPAVQAAAANFSAVAAALKLITPEVKAAYSFMARGNNWTWKDWAFSLYLKGDEH